MPGKEDSVWNELCCMNLDGSEREKQKSKALDGLIESYSASKTWNVKRQVLSVIAKKYTKSEIMSTFPNVTVWQIDSSRQHATHYGPGQPCLPEVSPRSKLDMSKEQHFMLFMKQPMFHKDIAYGSRKIQLDSGENIDIPNVVRCVSDGRIIRLYMQYCSEIQFEPLSERTLYRITNVCEASKQRSLKGKKALL